MSHFNSPQPPEAQLPRSVTFGLEIEMLVASTRRLPEVICDPQAPFDDPHPGDGRWCAEKTSRGPTQHDSEEAVAQCLVQAGIDNIWVHDRPPDQISPAAQASRNSLPRVSERYHNWRVMSEGSLAVEEWIARDPVLGRYAWSSVEIASAVFQSKALPDVWVPVAPLQAARIARICHTLTSNLRIRFSPSCALHLHLGLGGEFIPEDTIRRFVSVMWLVEDAVLSLCAPWRSGNKWSQPITKASVLARDWDGERDLWGSVQQFADLAALQAFVGDEVWDRMTCAQKVQMMLIWSLPLNGPGMCNLVQAIGTTGAGDGDGQRGTVSIFGAVLARDGPFAYDNVGHTIEIRYASGTLIAGELVSWTNLFVRLFQLCNWYDETNAARLKMLLHGVAWGYEWSTEHAGHELLRHVGLGEDTRVWEAARRRWALADDHERVRRSPFVEPQP